MINKKFSLYSFQLIAFSLKFSLRGREKTKATWMTAASIIIELRGARTSASTRLNAWTAADTETSA
jgi:hypothetical protein